jgi:hypothetical protein
LDYTKIHDSIIKRSILLNNDRQTEKKKHNLYYEKHHIIPKCMGGSNTRDNIVYLTAREHFIIHLLLCKIHADKSDAIKAKLACAILCMRRQPTMTSEPRIKSSRMFELARIEYIKNHPSKIAENRQKISKTLREKERPPKIPAETEAFVCACGCLDIGNRRVGSSQRYIHGHNRPDYDIVSRSLKATLANMSESEMNDRMKKSIGSCDHEQRGKRIAEGKRGKSTNQQKIMGERFASMTDIEFEQHINSLKDGGRYTRKRFTNLRNRYVRSDY